MTPVQMHKPHLTRDLVTTKPTTLEQIATAINREHEQAESSVRTAVEHAIACGRLLIEAKDKVGHGQWLPWLEKNFRGTPRTAQNYMMAAGKSETDAHLPDVHTTLRALYIAEPKPKPDSTTPSGRLQAAVQRPDPPEAPIVDATVVEDHDIDNHDADADWLPDPIRKQWAAAFAKARAVRELILEAGSPILPASAAEALTDAAVKAKELGAQLYDLAGELRKLA